MGEIQMLHVTLSTCWQSIKHQILSDGELKFSFISDCSRHYRKSENDDAHDVIETEALINQLVENMKNMYG